MFENNCFKRQFIHLFLILFKLFREYGENWHKAGMLLNKQNSYDDFHAAADFLIKNNYTNRNK